MHQSTSMCVCVCVCGVHARHTTHTACKAHTTHTPSLRHGMALGQSIRVPGHPVHNGFVVVPKEGPHHFAHLLLGMRTVISHPNGTGDVTLCGVGGLMAKIQGVSG